MRVRIVSCESPYYWYNSMVGREFDVCEYDEDCYKTTLPLDFESNCIRKADCIILKEEKEMNNVELAREILSKLTIEEAKGLGVSAETYANIKGNEEKLEWIPEIGGTYYLISEFGEIRSKNWENSVLDSHNSKTGNIFKTRKIAEQKLNDMNEGIAQKFIKIDNYVRNNNDGFVCDWNDDSQIKYKVFYCYEEGKWYSVSDRLTRSSSLYMSKQMAEKVLKMLNECE